ncbi:MAG: cytochrome P450 [Sphingomonadales bacterium]|nr:cytochrome P450 [Sphingomonadales bacterium]
MSEADTPLTLASPSAMACPFQVYEQIREQSPAYRDPVTGFFVVTGYDDIRQIAADPATFSSFTDLNARGDELSQEVGRLYDEAGFPPTNVLVGMDPPEHAGQRSLVDKVFSARRVREAEPAILAIVERLIDAFPQEPFDFCALFAVPLPMRMIAQQLGLGEDRLNDFKRWSDASVDQMQQGRSRETILRDARSIIEMRSFFCGEIRKVREEPKDTLLSALANTGNSDGELIPENDLSLLLQLLLTAGNETTTHAIGSAMLRLAQDAALQSRLRAEPSLVPAFIEEVLRLDAPLQGLMRTARRDTSIGDVPVPAGSVVNIRFAAGNRDARQFPQPDTLDLARQQRSHLTFGFGIHHCIGSQLARAEMRIALERLLARSSAIRLAGGDDSLARIPHFLTYGPRTLIVEFDQS